MIKNYFSEEVNIKSTKIILVISVMSIIFIATNLFCQINPDEVIKKAMKDEMSRNMENLNLEGLEKPFFISYTISDAKTLYISSTLGAVISSIEKPYRKHKVRVLVGDYKQSNENFIERYWICFSIHYNWNKNLMNIRHFYICALCR